MAEREEIDLRRLIWNFIPTIVCLIFTIVFIASAIKIVYFEKKAPYTTGVLIETKFAYDEDDRAVYYAKYEYYVNGDKYSTWSGYGKSKKSLWEEKEIIYYNSKNPEDAMLSDVENRATKKFLLGIIMGVITLIMGRYDYKRLKE